MSGEVVGLVGAVLGAVVGFVLTEISHRRRERREQQRQRSNAAAEAANLERRQIDELHQVLRRSGQLFADQIELRDRLDEQLDVSHPDVTPSRPGYEYRFKETYPLMTPEERQLHDMIAGYTDRIAEVNRELQGWLIGSRALRTRWANDPLQKPLAGLLDDLERHLDGWFVKYGRFQQGERARGLVYLADEDRLGPRFPTRIDAAVKELVAAGSPTTRGRD